MIKIIFNFIVGLLATITIIIFWAVTMLLNLLWNNQFKKTTAFSISEFMRVWNIKIDDL